jgi:hypothetical protein
MSLSDSQLERYARQVIIPGLGAEGQERLLTTRVLVLGREDQRATACEYLSRAGVTVTQACGEDVDCTIACDIDGISDEELATASLRGSALIWHTLDGRKLTVGCLHSFDGVRPSALEPPKSNDYDSALGSLAACDAAARAIALLLNWDQPDTVQEHHFA